MDTLADYRQNPRMLSHGLVLRVALVCALWAMSCERVVPKPDTASSEASTAHDAFAIPQLRGRVNDHADLLTSQQESELSAIYESLEKARGSQIGLLTIESLPSVSIEEYSLAVANRWGLGRRGIDDGLLITVAIQDRASRIEVGYGLELIISDAVAQQITKRMVRELAAGSYFKGLKQASLEIVQLIQQNPALVGKRRP